MQSNTKTNRTLAIDGMSGDDCVKKVTGALKSINGVETKSVGVGHAVVSTDDKGYAAACTAISDAGYRTRENSNNAQHDHHNSKGGQSNTNDSAGRGESDHDSRINSNRGKDTTNDQSQSQGQQRGRTGSGSTVSGNDVSSANSVPGSSSNSANKPAV